jgi:signal transduction histidine kinase
MTQQEGPALAQGSVEAFAALAAHQLGEAIALVRGAVSVLGGERARLGPAGDEALRALGAGSERAQRFVDDLLDLVRASGETVDGSRTRLEGALDAAVADLERPLAQVRLERDELPWAPLERLDAERLFVHLLRAAMAAGARHIAIRVGAPEDGELRLDIVDDGAAPADGASPFEPFAPPRGRGALVGAGVSLRVCRALVERAGGSIELGVRDDGRVAVVIRLPAQDG